MRSLLYPSSLVLLILLALSACQPGEPEVAASPAQSETATAFAPTLTQTALPLPSSTPLPSPVPSIKPPSSTAPVTGAAGEVIFVSETIPDGKQLEPGSLFRKTWTLRNGGSAPWTADYKLVLISSSPASQALGSPPTIPLTSEVQPNQTLEIGVDLIAPEHDGQYSATWQLQNADGELIFGSEVWVSIRVGDAVAADPVVNSGIRADLMGASIQGGEMEVDFCMQMPDERQWMPGVWDVTLLTDQGQFTPTGARINPATALNAYKCWSYSFQSAPGSGASYQLTIGKVELDATIFLEENCQRARQTLMPSYPGLNFECGDYRGFFYADLTLPPGMTKEQADHLILDVMSSAIYGPWVLSGAAP